MKRAAWLLMAFLWPIFCSAQQWEFSDPVLVAAEGKQIFHHLESSGRRNVAVSGENIAISWEDDRDGTPRVYLAQKQIAEPTFTADLRISGDGEAYEPSIAGLSDGQFVLAWEENEQVVARIAGPRGVGPVTRLSSNAGGQPSLFAYGEGAIIVWSERGDRFGHIRMAQLEIGGSQQLEFSNACNVEMAPAEDEQLYPAVAVVADELVVAWEDRRLGHTVIMAAQGRPCKMSKPLRISDKIEQRSVTYGKGHGVSRVALAGYGADALLAVWADKRDFREGYDIFSAVYRPGKGFAANIRVQDEFGGVARQWHPTVTGHNSGSLLVAWTDEREGNSDIMLSVFDDGEWGEDMPLEGAADQAQQSHPSILLDGAGRLHIAWVERDARDTPTRLKYMLGNRQAD